MSTLNEEILRLKNAKAAIDEVLIARGVSIPENATLDTYNELINSIQGGTSSEEVTATKANVLAGTTTITADSNDEIVEGTMPNYSGTQQDTDGVWIGNGYINMSVKNPGYYAGDSDLRAAASDFGDATQGNVLAGNTFTSSNGIKLSGTMLNNGAVSQALNCGGSYTIPAGYHDGTGKVTANSLASQTDGTATAAQILKDQTAYVDGVKVTGTMPNNGAVAPSALGAGGSYTIPAGYHNGSGKVTVQSLATLTASGDATAAQILSGKKAYVDGSLITGSMTDQGAKTSSLNCGGSYTIPAGYHNGSGKITANSLASQTDATATAAYIRSGYTAWVKGSKLTGSMAVTSAINFKATALSATSIRISWTNPSQGPWEGVFIQVSTSGNPGVSGGTRAYTGKGNSTTAGGSNYIDITGLSAGTTYYFTCTSYASGLGNGSSYNVNAKTTGLPLYSYGNNIAGYAYKYNATSGVNGNGVTFNSDHILVDEGAQRDLHSRVYKEPLYLQYSYLCVDVEFLTYPIYSSRMGHNVVVSANTGNTKGHAYTYTHFGGASAGVRNTYRASLAEARGSNSNNTLALHIDVDWGYNPGEGTRYGTTYPKMKYYRIWLE